MREKLFDYTQGIKEVVTKSIILFMDSKLLSTGLQPVDMSGMIASHTVLVNETDFLVLGTGDTNLLDERTTT